LTADTERLELEARFYNDTIREKEAQQESWKRALQIAAAASAADDNITSLSEDNKYNAAFNLEHKKEDLRSNLELLQDAIRAQEQELANLIVLAKEQALTNIELDRLEEEIEQDRNSLDIESKAFDNVHEQLCRNLLELRGEVERLSSPYVCLTALFYNLKVDKDRGLRYPLINDLRLAYRPKGDVQWEEIQVAWSLAAQLLLVVGTLFDFQSPHWKIVPLSHCAKVIYLSTDEKKSEDSSTSGKQQQVDCRPVVHNMGHPRTDPSKALQAWNALLHQVVHHTTIQVHKATEIGLIDASSYLPTLPYEISANKIGNIILGKLDENDDARWSKAVHYMASDLLWLSECASAFVLQKVILTTSAMAGEESR